MRSSRTASRLPRKSPSSSSKPVTEPRPFQGKANARRPSRSRDSGGRFFTFLSGLETASTLLLPPPAPRTTHHAPRTRHHAPGTTHQAPRTRHQAQSTKHKAQSTKHKAPSTRHLKHDRDLGERGADARHLLGRKIQFAELQRLQRLPRREIFGKLLDHRARE